MIKKLNLQNNRLAQHLSFWGAYLLFALFLSTVRSSVVEDMEFHFSFELAQTLFMAIAVYVNLRVLIPNFLEKRRYWVYSLLVILLMIANAYLFVNTLKVFPDLQPHFVQRPHPSPHWVIPILFMEVMLVAVSSALHFLRENAKLKDEALTVKALESSKLKAELDSLKSQINPHFLFNSLNNIYSHALLESKETPALILKLSGLLNYIIYECQDEQVTLEKELDFLKNYIDLEKVRIDESVEVTLEADVSDSLVSVAPLLFVPLVENAFKHGVNLSTGEPYIRVKLSLSDDHILSFSCENLKDTYPSDNSRNGGIGLENVQKRLELIYPGKHGFTIDAEGDVYKVTVQVQLGEMEA